MGSRHREVVVMAEHGAGHHHWVHVVPFHLPRHDPVATGWAQDTFHRIDGLDGLRGTAVLAVLVFHLWPGALPGGFIGVTLFFALSGFLITSILLHELEHTGTISLRSFYTRRFRRLLPVSLLTLAVVAVGWSMAGWLDGALRRDLFFSLGQSANWGQVLLAERYGVSPDASPVLHFWSLSIEEQLYLLLPLTLLIAGTRRRGQIVVALGIGVGVYAIVQSSDSASLSYYSSFTRAPEVLVGSLAALTMHGRHWLRRSSKAVAGTIVAIGVSALVWVAVTSNVTDPIFSRGALLGCAVLSMVVIAAVAGWPALGRRIDWWPLARLGQISYAVYLFHWPLLQTLRRTSLRPELVPWATLAATLALALLSERWFERPIRTGVVKGPRLVAVALCTAMLVPLVGAVGTVQGQQTTDFEAAAAQLDDIIDDAAHREPLVPVTSVAAPSLSPQVAGAESRWNDDGDLVVAPTTTVPAAPVRIGFFGDSKAMTLGLGAANYGFTDLEVGTSYAALGCPTGRGGKIREHDGAAVYPLADDCDWAVGVPAAAQAYGGLDVAVVWSGTWDLSDRKVPALGGDWTSVDDEAYRNWLLGEMVTMTDEIAASTGARRVLWLTVPVDPASSHPDRFATWTVLLHDLAQLRPELVQVVDIAAYVHGSGEAERLLPDGVHPSLGGDGSASNTGGELTREVILPVVETLRPQ
jgi:peptidoglycan/LPS O-acetylase OafA/YrhL